MNAVWREVAGWALMMFVVGFAVGVAIGAATCGGDEVIAAPDLSMLSGIPVAVGCPDCCRDCGAPWPECDCDHVEDGSEWRLGAGP